MDHLIGESDLLNTVQPVPTVISSIVVRHDNPNNHFPVVGEGFRGNHMGFAPVFKYRGVNIRVRTAAIKRMAVEHIAARQCRRPPP